MRNMCRYVVHRYDKVSHQCVGCGRYQPGYAPKKEPKHPKAECQCCEGKYAVRDGVMGHHGYKRPGYGYIVGDCYGVHHKPFPSYDAIEKMLASVVDRIAVLKDSLKEFPERKSFMVNASSWNPSNFERNVKPPMIKVEWSSDPYVNYRSNMINGAMYPSFDHAQRVAKANLDNELKWFEIEQRRLLQRLEKAKELSKESK